MTDEELLRDYMGGALARALINSKEPHALGLLKLIANVRADERERCAKVCEHIKVFAETNPVAVLIRCAAAIRAMK